MLVRLLLTAGVVACSAALLRMLEVRGFGWQTAVLIVMVVAQLFAFGMIQLSRRRRGPSDATPRPVTDSPEARRPRPPASRERRGRA